MKNFQIIILIVFIISAIVGVLVFSGTIPIGDQSKKEGAGGTVILWGTMKSADIANSIQKFNEINSTYTLQYEEKRADTFDQELLEALASGVGPDLFLISDELVYKYSNKILTIPYQSYPISVFKQNFVGAGEVFLTSSGSLAFPLAIDPIVMYYNRSILDTNNIVYPPQSWDELRDLVPILTRKDENKKILKSAVALGQFSNVTHAKDILSLLFMQTGNPIVMEKDGFFTSVLDQSINGYNSEQILESYVDFANPLKETYSWNKSLPNSLDSFSAENVAFYFGYGSELSAMIKRNPNLNFMVAPVPQIKDVQTKVTFARVTGIAVSKFSKNQNSAFLVANALASGDFSNEFAEKLGAVPARRGSFAASTDNAYQPTFYASALFAKSWLDPSPVDTNQIFQGMVEKVLSSAFNASQSLGDASSKLNLLFIK